MSTTTARSQNPGATLFRLRGKILCCPQSCPQYFGMSRDKHGQTRTNQLAFLLILLTFLVTSDLAGHKFGGGRGIRTPGRVPPSVVFKTTAFNRSAIPPQSRQTSLAFPAVVRQDRPGFRGWRARRICCRARRSRRRFHRRVPRIPTRLRAEPDVRPRAVAR